MYEQDYEEILVQYGEKLAIPDERLDAILHRLDSLIEVPSMVDRIAAILNRFSQSGRYKHIAYDPHAGAYVFIFRDGTRSAHSPAALNRLFEPSSERLLPLALRQAS